MSSCATTSGRSLYSQVSRITYRINDPPQFVKCGGKTPQTESRRRQAARSGKGPDEEIFPHVLPSMAVCWRRGSGSSWRPALNTVYWYTRSVFNASFALFQMSATPSRTWEDKIMHISHYIVRHWLVWKRFNACCALYCR